VWLEGKCWRTTARISEARSPAFIIENYDWTSGKYSTWAESYWNNFSVRIFVKPSLMHEVLTLSFGILILLVSFVLVGFFHSKTDLIFPQRYPSLLSSDAAVDDNVDVNI